MKPERWQEIERICNSALDVLPGERKAFVEKACAGNDALRKEVDRLLARQQEAEGFIAVPALEMAAKELAREEGSELGRDALPATLQHYRVIEKIGEGGMGVVYRASDTRLNRQVAIKVLPDVFAADRERLARFEREAKLLASLNHTNIAAIYGLEKTDGSPFLVMELVEGETLAQRIAKGPVASGRSPRSLPPDRRRARSRTRTRNHPPGPETRQRQDHSRGTRSRYSTSVWQKHFKRKPPRLTRNDPRLSPKS